MRKLLTALFALLFISQSAFSQSPGLYRKVSIQLTSADPVEVATALKRNQPEIQFPSAGLQLVHQIESPGGHHLTFDQTHQGIPVLDCGVKVTMTQSFRILSLMNSLQQVNEMFTGVFTHTSADAENLIRSLESENATQYQQEVRSIWVIRNSSLVPAWHARIYALGRSEDVYFADADMSVMERRNNIVNYRPGGGGGGVDGVAMVFNPDPLTTACVAYGAAYVDNNDLDNAALNNERQQVVLQDIGFDGTNYYLEGPYVQCENISTPAIAPPTNTTGDFSVTRQNDDFEWCMVYYHIDTFQRWIQSIGFNNLQNNPIRVDAHGLNGADNSHFVPSGSNSYLEFGDGCVDDAEDADVIIHEYGHALSYAAAPNTNTGNERNGLDEGIGDYVAASYSRFIAECFWDNVFTWDGHNVCWSGRDATTSMTYPPGGFNFYDYGEIWATAMMAFWNSEGREISDKVALQELYSNYSNMTLTDAAWLAIDADTLLYGGVHTQTLKTIFCIRGIFTGAACTLGNEDAAAQIDWTVFPNPASGEVSIQLPAGISGEWSLCDVQGREVRSGHASAGNTTVNLAELPAGTWLMKLETVSGKTTVKKLVIE